MNSIDQTIGKVIEVWTQPPFDDATVAEIKRLIDIEDWKELNDRFYRQLEFGTGGLRGVIGAGINRMNIYTVGMASQGLANYVKKACSGAKSAVIARDSRRLSLEFAQETASILAANGIKVFFLDDIAPIPLASYAIRRLGAGFGVVITASHNPPEYNGYKVFWSDGAQIVPPHDEGIISEVRKIQDIQSIKKIEFDECVESGQISIIGDEMLNSYTDELSLVSSSADMDMSISIVYTPIHGTGYRAVPESLRKLGFENITIVPSQAVPDGNFPTVKSPNPEEREALSLAIELAEKINADIVLGTDPDTDRMGIAYRNAEGKYMLLNGNQTGSLLEYYMLSRMSEEQRLPENAAVVKTIVTTELQRKIADYFEVHIEDVLTGFKWIADKIHSYEEEGSFEFVFGGEESFGYLPHSRVRDKDAVASCCCFVEMAAYLKSRNMTVGDYLDEVYLKFGLYLEDLHSVTLKGSDGVEIIKSIMSRMRKNPPADFCGKKVRVVRDYLTGITLSDGEKSMNSIKLPPSDVIQFTLDDGSLLTLRPSGTEPKIKFYFSVNAQADKDSLADKKTELEKNIMSLKEAMEVFIK